MNPTLTLVVPTCSCCAEPRPLLPRDDLATGLAVCGTSGQLYQLAGGEYVPTSLPNLARRERSVSSVQIDLSQSGYA